MSAAPHMIAWTQVHPRAFLASLSPFSYISIIILFIPLFSRLLSSSNKSNLVWYLVLRSPITFTSSLWLFLPPPLWVFFGVLTISHKSCVADLYSFVLLQVAPVSHYFKFSKPPTWSEQHAFCGYENPLVLFGRIWVECKCVCAIGGCFPPRSSAACVIIGAYFVI